MCHSVYYAAGVLKCSVFKYMGTQVSYSMMSIWLFFAWAGCS